jgi:hypothetical protein
MLKKVNMFIGLLLAGYILGMAVDKGYSTWEKIHYEKPAYVKEAEAKEKLRKIENGE